MVEFIYSNFSLFIYFFIYSANDVAMVVKYVFTEDDVQVEHSIKKRKLSDSKLKSLIDYSQIKLPAQMFLHYLENYGSQFVNECVRYNAFPYRIIFSLIVFIIGVFVSLENDVHEGSISGTGNNRAINDNTFETKQ